MKKLIQAIAFILLTALMMAGTYSVLSWKDTSGGYLSVTQQLYATEENLIDVVFMGSSHCYCGINPSVLWENHGISAFNMSVSGQDKDSAYYELKELLKTQSPKVVFIDAWALTFDKHAKQSNVYRNMLAMKTSGNSIDLVKSYIDKEEQADYILRWPIVHTRYKELSEFDFRQYEPSEYGRGYYPSYTATSVSLQANALNCTESVPLSDKNREWLDDLQALSKEENFDLVMFLIPAKFTEEEQRIMNGATEYMKEKGITYLDYNIRTEELALDYNTDFMDPMHMNIRGARKITTSLGDYLMENYELADHRGDDAYYLWDECSEYLAHLKFEYELKLQTDMITYMKMLTEYDDLVVVVSLDGNYQESTLDFKSVADVFGIPETEYYIGGKWVFENGERIYYMDSSVGEAYVHDLSETQTLRMRNIPGSLSQLEIAGKPVSSVYNGLNIVVYDRFTNEMIDQRGYF